MNNQIKKDMKSILDNRPELAKEVNKSSRSSRIFVAKRMGRT